MIRTDGRHFPKPIILTAIRWYLAHSLSYRDLEELLAERGIVVDHSTIARWVARFSPPLLAAFRRRKRAVGTSWRMDETSYLGVRDDLLSSRAAESARTRLKASLPEI